jgi:hypothetical protein
MKAGAARARFFSLRPGDLPWINCQVPLRGKIAGDGARYCPFRHDLATM